MTGELEHDNAAGDVVEYTVRVPCAVCGRPYALPKGQRRPPAGIGPCCQPPLDVALEGRVRELLEEPEPTLELDVDEPPPARELGLHGLVDVLCEGCRGRLADGRLSPPGAALCLDCAVEVVEHWLAWLDNPQHGWWPSDDPFGSARYPVAGWHETGVA